MGKPIYRLKHLLRMLFKHSIKSKTAKDGSKALTLKFISLAISLLLNITITRNLGAEESGIYFFCNSLLLTIAVFSRIGYDQANLRFLSPLLYQEKSHEAKSFITQGAIRILTTTCISTTIALSIIAILRLVGEIDASKVKYYSIIFIVLIPFNFAQWSGTISRARRNYIQSESILLLGIQLPVLIVLHFGDFNTATELLLILLIVAFSLATFSGCELLFWIRSITKKIAPTITHEKISPLRFSILKDYWIISSTQIVIQNSPTLMLGIFAAKSEVAVFHIAFRLASLQVLLLGIATAVVSPQFASYFESKELSKLNRFYWKTTISVILLSLPIFMVGQSFAPSLLGLFGNEFSTSTIIFRIILTAQFLNTLTGPLSALLQMTNNQESSKQSVIIALLIQICFGFSLIPFYGALGGAITISLSVIAQTAFLLHRAQFHLNIFRKHGD